MLTDNSRGYLFQAEVWSRTSYALNWLATSSTRPAVALVPFAGRGIHQAVNDAVDAAVSSGMTVVVAAGHGGGYFQGANACQFSPSFVNSAITVGWTDRRDIVTRWANWGECVNIWAPGSTVRTAGHRSDTDIVSHLGRSSTASSYAAGGAALVLAADPTKSASKVRSEMTSNAIVNCVARLRQVDTNALLYVGEDGPPPCECPDFCTPNRCNPGGYTPHPDCALRCDFCARP